MASGLAWLDNSREDQQRVRELLNMFSETESRDELGVGQIRDAFSELLFPGTSTLHTRARYLLIVPWCFLEAERRGLRGERLDSRVGRNERTVIDTLRKAGETEGLIGRVAGVAVKTLPSVIYHSALLRYRIRTCEDNPSSLTRTVTTAIADAAELTERPFGTWHPTLPKPPEGFPSVVEGGLALAAEEARWLRERILTSAPDSLLAHLLAADRRPDPGNTAPWEDPATDKLPEPVATNLRHAQRFSLAMHGAALLYNLLIAEHYETAGYTEQDQPVQWYRDALADWNHRISTGPDLSGWDRADMWTRATEQNPRIAGNVLMRTFIDRWLGAVIDGSAASAADDEHLRRLVTDREQAVKRAQSRLINDKLLRAWSGASGSQQLTFRWTQVRRLLIDIHDGCQIPATEVADAAA